MAETQFKQGQEQKIVIVSNIWKSLFRAGIRPGSSQNSNEVKMTLPILSLCLLLSSALLYSQWGEVENLQIPLKIILTLIWNILDLKLITDLWYGIKFIFIDFSLVLNAEHC